MEPGFKRSEDTPRRCTDQRRAVAFGSAKESAGCFEMAEKPKNALRRSDRPRRPFGQAEDQGRSMKVASLREIPAVEKVLVALGETGLPRLTVVAVARRELAELRKQKTIPDFDAVLARVRDALRALRAARIRPLINGTGILVHTNLGRAPLGPAVIETLSKIGSHYSNLEYALSEG